MGVENLFYDEKLNMFLNYHYALGGIFGRGGYEFKLGKAEQE